MKIEFDNAKNETNKAKHGLDFEDAIGLLWEDALYKKDNRFDYDEDRFQAFVYDTTGQPYVVVFTLRDKNIRIISFRRAHEKERRKFNV